MTRSAPPPKRFLFLLLLTLLGRHSLARRLNPCRGICACFKDIVSCTREKLISIPNNFDLDFKQLIIKNQPFVDKTLRRHNISYLTNVEELYINNCGLELLEVGVFSDLRKLRHVDLSGNRIRDIHDFTFRGLQLKFLFLNNNPDIRLHPRSFGGLSTAALSMKNCGLRAIAYETFLALNTSIRSLWLNENELADLDPRFQFIFGHLETLDVKGNPFQCKCGLRWLVSYLRRQSSLGSGSDDFSLQPNPSPAERPRCALPKELAGMELRTLSPSQLTCDPPRLGNAEVVVQSGRSGRLRCTATGYPQPKIVWSRVLPLSGRNRGLPTILHVVQPSPFSLMNLSPNRPVVAVVDVDRRRPGDLESYQCTASNDGGNVSLVVRVKWPPKQPPVVSPVVPSAGRPVPPAVGPSQLPKNPGTGLGPFDEDPRLNYQFTLLELIGAVVGTFTATLALFLLICRCITYAKKKQKKQQWSTYESAYSGSHVYDVPRNEQAYMPKTGDRHEFLDFKTGRKVYDHV